MKTFVRLLAVIYACAATQAFAIDPPSSPAKPGNPTAAQSVGANAVNASAKRNRNELEDKTLTNEEVRQLFAQGYKPVGRGGEVHYCRRELEIGSRFAKMVCKTGDQIKQITRDSKDMLATGQKPGGCSAGGC